MPETTKYKVFLTDDHQLILDGLQSLLAQTTDFEVIATARNGREALQKVPILKPELVLMDLDMPKLNGMEATRELKVQCPEVKVVILSMHLEQSLVRRLTEIGADGYMVKDSDREEFLHGLRLVMQGKRYYSSLITQALIEESSMPPSKITLNLKLSDRELEVLRRLVEGYSSKEIASDLDLGIETIHTYRKSLLRKLNARNVAHLVKIALQAGIVH